MRVSSIVACAVMAAAAGAAVAQPAVFTEWNFNSLPTNVIINSPPPSTGHGTAVPLGMDSVYHFDTSPAQNRSYTCCDVLAAGASGDSGNPNNCWRVRGSFDGTLANAGLGWALQAPQYTQGAEFDVSTVNYSGIVVTFDWFTTNQGVRNMQVQYSTDAGATWTNTGPVLIAQQNGWRNTQTADLSTITAVNDNANVRVRLVSVYDPSYSGSTPNPVWPHLPTYTGASGGQYNNNSGNWRFDRVTFTGTPIRSVPPAVVGAVAPTAICSSGGTLTFTASVNSGVDPLSTGIAVTADLSSLGLSSTQQLFDDGANGGDAVAGDSVYTYTATVPGGQTVGNHTIPVTVTDAQGRNANTTISFAVGNCGVNSSSRVVISQTFGAGGNLGVIPSQDSPYNADYVELYNRSNQTVSLAGWSVQYADAAGSSGFSSATNQVPLSGVIQPGQYMLVRMGDPVAGYNNLPTPDFAQLPNFGGMNDLGGRVALVRSMTLLGTNYNDPSIEDFVGYGGAAANFEGAGPTPTPNPSSNHAMVRNQSGAQDTNQNFNDFTNSSPAPHNRSSGFLAGYASSDVSAVCAGSTITFFVNVPNFTAYNGVSVTADVSQIVGSPSTVHLFDDGTHGDVSAADGIYTLAYAVPIAALQGNRTVTITTSDTQGHVDTTTLPVAVGNCGGTGAPVVISQVYGGGGNASSGFNADYAQIFNRSASPVDMTGWSFQSCRVSDAGFDSRICLLSGTINPGEYRLIVCSTPVSTGAVLPPADFMPNPPFNMESASGRTALVRTSNLLHEDFTRSDIVDLVGYGTDCQTYEGVAPVGGLSDYTVAVRKQGGCQDTNQNAMDFDVVLTLVLPQSGASTPAPCPARCGTADFNCDGAVGTDADIEAFFACLSGSCPPPPCMNTADFNGDGAVGTDADIESFFRVLSGGAC
jgi:hypothetical protein